MRLVSMKKDTDLTFDDLLYASMIRSAPLLVRSKERAREIERASNYYGLDIPKPVTTDDVLKEVDRYPLMYVDRAGNEEMIKTLQKNVEGGVEVLRL